MKPFVTGSLVAVTALSLTSNVLMYLRYSSSRPLVTVGSQVISKKNYQDALEYQTQGAVLRKMVLASLINQAAAKAGLTPSQADVDARLADLRRRDPQALTAADQDPVRMTQMRADIQTQIALENLQLQGTSISDAEVAAFYRQHKSLFTEPAQVQTTMVVAQNSVDAAEAASLLRQNIALDVIGRQPRLHVVGIDGFNLTPQTLSAGDNAKLTAAVFRTPAGGVQVVPIGRDYFVLHATGRAQAGTPPLPQIRAQVARLARLNRSVPAAVEVARLYQAANPQFSVARDAAVFADLTTPASGTAMTAQRTADAQ